MDPFLPGEIPVMVLRYLTANQCLGTALKLIEEMPRMKDYLPAKPPQVAETAYLKHLLRSSVNPGLKEVLWDYGNSKILIEEMLDTEDGLNMFPSSNSECLMSKIKKVQERFKIVEQSGSPVRALTSSSQKEEKEVKQSPVVVKKDISTNTDDYECPSCINRVKNQPPPKSDSGSQTEEYTAVQLGLREEIPILFYKTLLNDNSLQDKIVQTINEHMDDSPEKCENFVQKISSKTETEIDKFLVELLQDMPDDSSSLQSDNSLVQIQNLGGPTSFADIERNLSSMFGEPDNLVGNNGDGDIPGAPVVSVSNLPEPPEKLLASLPEAVSLQTSGSTPNLIVVSTQSPSSSTSCDTCETSQEEKNLNPRKITDFIAPTGETRTPKRSRRHQTVKRITPTPLSSAHVNPVFNTSVVVEKQTIGMGDKSAKMSVITANIETPGWQKLSRRSIAPRIPGLLSPKIIHNVTILNQEREEVISLGPDDANRNINVALSSDTVGIGAMGGHSNRTEKDQGHPSSAKKRKTTPVKLTPEKAKNSDYNFMHVYIETNKPTSSIKLVDSDSNTSNNSNVDANIEAAVKKTPSPSTSTASNQSEISNPNDNELILSSENSQNDVTPMQPPPPVETLSTSTLKTISPNAIQRLIASANKIITTSTTTASHFMNKKKSFSTPRKRKHVRSLTFATPPSLKTITPGGVSCRGGSASAHKRKIEDDYFSAELRSKKRLNWPDSDKKKKILQSDSSVGTQTPASAFAVREKRASERDYCKQEKDVKKGKGKQSETKKKPKIMLPLPSKLKVTHTHKDLFGESPVKKKLCNPKLPADVVAAQAVAFQAVPLGSPRRSPRKLSAKIQRESEKTPSQKARSSRFHIPAHNVVGKDLAGIEPRVPEHDTQEIVSHPEMPQIPEPPQHESVEFNIVPAPLGFPEPTPIKNFAETGCLNISELTCDTNGPLITPFKSVPPPGLNDTHFTLPPTPRVMVEDNDSNSNSTNSLRLILDSFYSTNLLTSTPMKLGLPRTPGKGSSSSSSNSQSPIQTVKTVGGAVQGQDPIQQGYHQPVQTLNVPMAPTQTTEHSVPPPPSNNANVSKPVICSKASAVLSPRDKSKSDGEISSSDEEDGNKAKPMSNSVPQKSQSPLKFQQPQARNRHQPPPKNLQQPLTRNNNQPEPSDLHLAHDRRQPPAKDLQQPISHGRNHPQPQTLGHQQPQPQIHGHQQQQLQTNGHQQTQPQTHGNHQTQPQIHGHQQQQLQTLGHQQKQPQIHGNQQQQPNHLRQTYDSRQPPPKDLQQPRPHGCHQPQHSDFHQAYDSRKLPPKDLQQPQTHGRHQPQTHGSHPPERNDLQPQARGYHHQRHQLQPGDQPQTRSYHQSQSKDLHRPQSHERHQSQPTDLHEPQTNGRHQSQRLKHPEPETQGHPQPHNGVPTRSQVVSSSVEPHRQNGNYSSQHNRPSSRPPSSQPVPHISVSLNPNLKQTHGINFHVGGREKLLTISEKETLYSLINMGSVVRVQTEDEVQNENPLGPIVKKPSIVIATASQKQNEGTDDESQLSVRDLFKNKKLDFLIKAVRRKEQASKNT